MFSLMTPLPPDPVLSITTKFNADPRTQKFDLGVGVYRDETGHTPIPAAVKQAERDILAAQTTKTYISPAGNPAFNDAVSKLVLGESLDTARTFAVQTPGGTGAIKNLLDLAFQVMPDAVVWLSAPTWPNHGPIAAAAGLITASYPYYDVRTGTLLFDEMMSALAQVPAGDIVVLHGCCHNPSGADLSLDQWAEVAALLEKRGAIPLIDIAYLGLGDGLDEDAKGLRLIATRCEEVMIAASCSKNFGLYRDRVGAAIVKTASAELKQVGFDNAAYISRSAFSMPPDIGASVVARVLETEALRASWIEELDTMRRRINDLRGLLTDELRQQTNSERFDFLAGQKGMFSLLGTSPAQAATLERDHGVYLPASGRINIAGLNTKAIAPVATAIAAVCR
ncbi:MAG: amino acid aminotransferase [Pseudomonadota bacterium]|nr:amino acid aminotransferase [Pseudomonadota bacterium]